LEAVLVELRAQTLDLKGEAVLLVRGLQMALNYGEGRVIEEKINV
jgi:hypothetical protein